MSELPAGLVQKARYTGNILLVEDDELVRETLCNKLTRLGYTVWVAENGDAALRLLRQNPNLDLVFSDVVMPGKISGADLARHVRGAWPHVQVILTSGYTDKTLERAQLPEGIKLLHKPYSNATLEHFIWEAMAA